jgi:hypothetical protein
MPHRKNGVAKYPRSQQEPGNSRHRARRARRPVRCGTGCGGTGHRRVRPRGNRPGVPSTSSAQAGRRPPKPRLHADRARAAGGFHQWRCVQAPGLSAPGRDPTGERRLRRGARARCNGELPYLEARTTPATAAGTGDCRPGAAGPAWRDRRQLRLLVSLAG